MDDSTPLKFPFKYELSLHKLVDYWENRILSGEVPYFISSLLPTIREHQDLRQPITDPSIFTRHRELIDFMMSAVFPSAHDDEDLMAATPPFQLDSFFSTRNWSKTIRPETFERDGQINFPGHDMVKGKIIHACLLILEKYYGVPFDFDKPILFTIANPENGLSKVYKIEIGRQFFDIDVIGELPKIDPRILKYLTEKVYDVDLWMNYLKPENFLFKGFMVIKLVDVTEQEMLSGIKYDLLEKNAVTKEVTFSRIQHKIRSIFNMPQLRMGLAYFDTSNRIILNGGEESACWQSVSATNDAIPCDWYDGSIYERSWMDKRISAIESLEEFPLLGKVEQSLLKMGVRNILLAPLVDEGETIGLLELTMPTVGKLNAMSASKLENVLPMFTAAVKRVKEEMVTEVRALIQEECTNIHPAVQWKFFDAGLNLLNKRRHGERAALEEISFNNVYPLFGLADVRNSSIERNRAIEHDLKQNLKMVHELLSAINEKEHLPVLDEICFKTQTHLSRIAGGLASGDESNTLEFLKSEVSPMVEHFVTHPDFKEAVAKYKSALDPVFGVVYKKRKAFEQSLEQINRMIAAHLDEAQAEAQKMFPHYFEKYQTDGVEFTLYVGSSIAKDKKFDPFYLRNFRLWQLLLMTELDRKMDQLKPTLKNKLDITQLILVHDQPLSIRFRPDEKQFDVDGAYDIRYEIVKKRIDKAFIKNTGERLTQPGKIAIVYNQAKVEEEYRRYFEFLRSKHLITANIEELELEELQGAKGLRALRIEIVKTITPKEERNLAKDLEEALRVN